MKFRFTTKKLLFLGYTISVEEIQVCEEIIKKIREWSTPKTISKVQNLHRLTTFYKCFICISMIKCRKC